MSKGLRRFSLLAVLVLASCTQQGGGGTDPKGRLTDYISKSFSVSSLDDRKALMGYLTGESKARLENWSDEQFLQAFVNSKRKFVKLRITEVKPTTPGH